MRIIKAIWFFYRKLIIPALVSSVAIGLGIGGVFYAKTIGVTYLFLSLLFHYFIYEVKNKNEYYFYYNLGLSRLTLWGITFVLGLMVSSFFMII